MNSEYFKLNLSVLSYGYYENTPFISVCCSSTNCTAMKTIAVKYNFEFLLSHKRDNTKLKTAI